MFYSLFNVLREDVKEGQPRYRVTSWHGVQTFDDEGAMNDAVQELLEEIKG